MKLALGFTHKLLMAFCLFVFANSTFATTNTLIIWVNRGNPNDPTIRSDLSKMIGILNAGGNSSGYTYGIKFLDTFEGTNGAFALATSHLGYNEVIGVYHGLLDPITHVYRHQVGDTHYDYNDYDVDPRFMSSYHCTNDTIDYIAIGKAIAASHNHAFGNGSSSSSGTVNFGAHTDGTSSAPTYNDLFSFNGQGGIIYDATHNNTGWWPSQNFVVIDPNFPPNTPLPPPTGSSNYYQGTYNSFNYSSYSYGGSYSCASVMAGFE